MKIILFILTLFSLTASSQVPAGYNLYAERRNVDNTIDSFFVKFFKDSVFNKQGTYICATVESFDGIQNPVYPNGFGQFTKHADNIYRDARYFSGYPVYTITIHADAGTNLALTNQANTEQALGNSQRNAIRTNTTGFLEARLTAIVMSSSTSVNNPRIYFQYSADGVNWTGGGNGISLSATGAFQTAWVALPEGAIGDVFIRVAQNGGNNTEDPALGHVTIQFR